MGRCPLGRIAFRVAPVAMDRVQLLPSELFLLAARGSCRLRRLTVSTINKRGKHGASTRRSHHETCPYQQPRFQRTKTIRGSHRVKRLFSCFRKLPLTSHQQYPAWRAKKLRIFSEARIWAQERTFSASVVSRLFEFFAISALSVTSFGRNGGRRSICHLPNRCLQRFHLFLHRFLFGLQFVVLRARDVIGGRRGRSGILPHGRERND
jgi:hypothetical protein